MLNCQLHHDNVNYKRDLVWFIDFSTKTHTLCKDPRVSIPYLPWSAKKNIMLVPVCCS